MYWRLTPVETEALLREIDKREERLQRADTLRTGLIASILLNRWRKKGAKLVKPEDFLPYRPPPPASPKQVRDYLMTMAMVHNASLKGKAN